MSFKILAGFDARHYGTSQAVCFFVSQCQACRGPVTIFGRSVHGSLRPETVISRVMDAESDIIRTDFRGIERYPQIEEIEAPEHTPPNVARAFIEARENEKEGRIGSAGMGYRKALDRASKKLGGDPDKFLASRLRELVSAKSLHPTLSEWAESIRLLGNEAAHEDEDPVADDVQAIGQFTEMFLTYAFTMPERVKRYRGKDQNDLPQE